MGLDGILLNKVWIEFHLTPWQEAIGELLKSEDSWFVGVGILSGDISLSFSSCSLLYISIVSSRTAGNILTASVSHTATYKSMDIDFLYSSVIIEYTLLPYLLICSASHENPFNFLISSTLVTQEKYLSRILIFWPLSSHWWLNSPCVDQFFWYV